MQPAIHPIHSAGTRLAAALAAVTLALAAVPAHAIIVPPPGPILISRLYTTNGPADGDDQAKAVVMDHQNKPVTCGFQTGVGTGKDFVVRKVGTGGWTRTLNGTSNADDVANAVAVDSQDNIFACGVLHNNGSNEDFVVGKWDANGNLLWTRTLNGTLAGSNDRANALAVDNQNNVVVVGLLTNQGNMGDFAVMRWDPMGTPCPGWGTSAAPAPKLLRGDVSLGFDEALAVAVDTSRNIVAVGNTEWTHPWGDGTINPHGDFTVMKWDEAGNALWWPLHRAGSSLTDDSTALDVTMAADDSFAVSGYLFNNGSGRDLVVGKWLANGTPAPGWGVPVFPTLPNLLSIAGTKAGGYDEGRSVRMDAQGNVYVAGRIANNTSLGDFAVVKIRFDRTILWQTMIDGGVNDQDEANQLVLDASGNSYVAGFLSKANTGRDFALISFDNAGAERWRQTFNGSANANDVANGVALSTTNYATAVGKVRNLVVHNLLVNTALDDYAIYF